MYVFCLLSKQASNIPCYTPLKGVFSKAVILDKSYCKTLEWILSLPPKLKAMIAITLPDGSIKNFEPGVTPFDVAMSISEGLARNVISATFNEGVVETCTPLEVDGSLTLHTWQNEEGKKAFWHSSAHILAQALEQLYPGVKLWVGPAIERGFYYDVDLGEESLSEKDFKAIEDKMLEIARGKHDFKMRAVSKDQALSYYKGKNEYKVD